MTRSSPTAAPADAPASGQPGWVCCPDCGWLLYRKRLDRNLHVCPECDHHLRLSARARIVLLTDPGSFTETAFLPGTPDPLHFTDHSRPSVLTVAVPPDAPTLSSRS